MGGAVSRIKLWHREDIDGFFGLFTNNLTNLLVMAGLLNISIGMPAAITYGKILPAVGLSIFASSLIYSWMAYRLAKKEGRDTVTALPSGTSVPHMFLIVFLIMGPVYWKTGDPYIAWFAGLAWGFVEGIIELSGSLIGAKVRKVLPRAAMLGSLAGVSLTFIVMTPAMQTFDLPYIGFISLAIIFLGWFGKVKLPFRIPVGLFAIIIGTIIGWITRNMDISAVTESAKQIQLSVPTFSVKRIIDGFSAAGPFLIAAIPLGIYNFFETIDNIESAEVAGDSYNTKQALIADGSTTILASLFGSPFPTAVFIGHVGWKEAGARIGYTWATGLSILVLTWLGLISLLLTIIPLEAIVPILIYIGLIIGAQAFQHVDMKYAPAVILAMIPWIANWGQNIVDTAFTSADTSALEVGYAAIATAGLEYSGLLSLGTGAIIIGMIWSSILVFIIDQNFKNGAVVCLIGTILSFFGIIHYKEIGIGVGWETAISYAVVGLILLSIYVKQNTNNMEEL
ncbi:xanthine permease [Cerasibacillus sp. JNUCC 74]